LGWVRRELDDLGIPPLKRFGQHFLLDKQVRDTMIDQAELSDKDTVVEVGAGLGFLTAVLASRAGHLIAVEKDRTLANYLADKFANNRNVEVVQGDALEVPIPAGAKIVSSPPYNISSKLTLHILNSGFELASLLLQEDFVRRLTAPSGSREYGRLTVMLQTRARAEYVMKVPASSFYPKPKVDSALVTIRPASSAVPVMDPNIFLELVRTLFTQRRRKLRGVLSRYLNAKYVTIKEKVLSEADMTEKRVYELTPTEFISLSNVIADAVKSDGTSTVDSGRKK
jgi:16S rRNA (adenine1518-N6/adenine1519-N6)-dimethyltransferase